VLELNPQRREKILLVTGWTVLEPGSLNLKVDDVIVDQLLQYKPVLEESAESITYPHPYEHIPALRKRYFYFRAFASVGGKRQEVLVRRAECPPYEGLVELFAPVSLRTRFGLNDEDTVTVEVND